MKLWNAYCILRTALLKVATSPVRRQTHPKPLQGKVTIVMTDTPKKFRDQMEQQICWIWVRESFTEEAIFELKPKEE